MWEFAFNRGRDRFARPYGWRWTRGQPFDPEGKQSGVERQAPNPNQSVIVNHEVVIVLSSSAGGYRSVMQSAFSTSVLLAYRPPHLSPVSLGR